MVDVIVVLGDVVGACVSTFWVKVLPAVLENGSSVGKENKRLASSFDSKTLFFGKVVAWVVVPKHNAVVFMRSFQICKI